MRIFRKVLDFYAEIIQDIFFNFNVYLISKFYNTNKYVNKSGKSLKSIKKEKNALAEMENPELFFLSFSFSCRNNFVTRFSFCNTLLLNFTFLLFQIISLQ